MNFCGGKERWFQPVISRITGVFYFIFRIRKNRVKSLWKPSYEDPPSVPSEEIIASPIEAQIHIDNRNENSFEFLENPEDTGVGTKEGSKVKSSRFYISDSMDISPLHQNILYSTDFLDNRRADSREKRWNNFSGNPGRIEQHWTNDQVGFSNCCERINYTVLLVYQVLRTKRQFENPPKEKLQVNRPAGSSSKNAGPSIVKSMATPIVFGKSDGDNVQIISNNNNIFKFKRSEK